MGKNVSQQLIGTHLVEGRMEAGQDGLRIDQTFTQDATGSMVMLELEADPPFPSQDRSFGGSVLGWCCPITDTRAGRCLRGGRPLEGWRVPCADGSSYVKSSTQCTTGTRASCRR